MHAHSAGLARPLHAHLEEKAGWAGREAAGKHWCRCRFSQALPPASLAHGWSCGLRGMLARVQVLGPLLQ